MTILDWDDLDDAGHFFTHVSGPIAGDTFYYCERCASLLFVKGISEISMFHPARGSESIPKKCRPLQSEHEFPQCSLRQKLEVQREMNLFDQPICSLCAKELEYVGEPHDQECLARCVMNG